MANIHDNGLLGKPLQCIGITAINVNLEAQCLLLLCGLERSQDQQMLARVFWF